MEAGGGRGCLIAAHWRIPARSRSRRTGAISHIERDVINLHRLEAFARHFGLPLVKWRCKMVDEIDDRALRDDLYGDEPNLWQYFVEVRRPIGGPNR